MNRSFLCGSLYFLLVLAIFPNSAKAQGQNKQVILPAGTLLRCTINEPNFSSKTADVGDPVVCPLSSVFFFGHTVFPRGAYLGGRLEADKDPGHFFGKGYLKLEFDHIGLPDEQVPVPAKIIAASRYKVDKQGKIIGRGHATRDTVEWMLPPLWPIKVLTLPARGPRPTLKGEEQMTLRLMDDVSIPVAEQAEWHSFGRPSAERLPSHTYVVPNRYFPSQTVTPSMPHPANPPQTAVTTTATSSAESSSGNQPRSVLVLRNGVVYPSIAVYADGNRLRYTLSDGTSGEVGLDEIDWTKTFQSNAENGGRLALVSANTAH